VPILQRRGDVLTANISRGPDLHADTKAWLAAATAAGGTMLPDSIAIADRLARALAASTFTDKIVWFLPLLGANLNAALTPLRDSLGVGNPTAYSLTDSDFAQPRGLQGDGSSKYLDTLIKPSDLGSGSNGGLGWWETNFVAGTAPAPIGMVYNPGDGTRAYRLVLTATRESFDWNQDLAGRFAITTGPAGNGHYYGQRSTATFRTLYKNGIFLASSSVSDPADGISYQTMAMLGEYTSNVVPGPRYWPGRCGCAYMTTGTLSTIEIADLHAIIRSRLIVPTGRG
jgi:hypothetical protein